MGEGSNERAQLEALVEENRRLAREAWRKSHELEQILAARKDALREGVRRATWPGLEVLTSQANTKGQLGRKPAKVEEPHSSRERCPILILVEDNADDFTLLKRALWKVGASARVWWAKGSIEALEILAQVGSPGTKICIVSDVKLPEVDGFELLRQVKATCGSFQLKFAFLTGDQDKKTEARAHACGVDGFFLKPNRWEDLVETARALQKLAVQS